MSGKVIFQACVIGMLSTGMYVVFTKNDRVQSPYQKKDRDKECLCIGLIVTIVSALLLLMTGKSDQLVIKETQTASLNYKPPF